MITDLCLKKIINGEIKFKTDFDDLHKLIECNIKIKALRDKTEIIFTDKDGDIIKRMDLESFQTGDYIDMGPLLYEISISGQKYTPASIVKNSN